MYKNQNPSIYNTINAKNWLIVYHLRTNTKKMLRVLSKNAIVTSLPVIEGTPYFVNLCVMHFRQSWVEPRQSNFLFKSYLKKTPRGCIYAPLSRVK